MWPLPASVGKGTKLRRQLQPCDYTVGWICAIHPELAAAQEMLNEEHAHIPDHNDTVRYTLGRIYSHNVVIACLPGGSIGTQSAATVAARMRSRFTNIKFGLLMVGIGGGVPSIEQDIRLGDVVVSHPYQQHGGVVQHDFGKTMPQGHMRTGWLNAPPPVLLSAIVEQRARRLRRQSTLENHLADLEDRVWRSSPKSGPVLMCCSMQLMSTLEGQIARIAPVHRKFSVLDESLECTYTTVQSRQVTRLSKTILGEMK